MENRQMLVQMLPGQVSNVLGRLNLSYEKLQEIRMRAEKQRYTKNRGIR